MVVIPSYKSFPGDNYRMPQPDTDRLLVTEEARMVAREITSRGYHWTDGYEDSFSNSIDSLRDTEDHRPYLDGSTVIMGILDHVPKGAYSHGVWKDLGVDPQNREGLAECCKGIIRALC